MVAKRLVTGRVKLLEQHVLLNHSRAERISYPRYMSKVNAHYERIDPRNGVRNSVPRVDSILMCIVKVHSQRIDHRNGVSHSVSGVNPFIIRIYFAHVTGVNDAFCHA